MLQEVMHSHSISVVEEAVLEPNHQAANTPAGTQTHTHTHTPVHTLRHTDTLKSPSAYLLKLEKKCAILRTNFTRCQCTQQKTNTHSKWVH